MKKPSGQHAWWLLACTLPAIVFKIVFLHPQPWWMLGIFTLALGLSCLVSRLAFQLYRTGNLSSHLPNHLPSHLSSWQADTAQSWLIVTWSVAVVSSQIDMIAWLVVSLLASVYAQLQSRLVWLQGLGLNPLMLVWALTYYLLPPAAIAYSVATPLTTQLEGLTWQEYTDSQMQWGWFTLAYLEMYALALILGASVYWCRFKSVPWVSIVFFLALWLGMSLVWLQAGSQVNIHYLVGTPAFQIWSGGTIFFGLFILSYPACLPASRSLSLIFAVIAAMAVIWMRVNAPTIDSLASLAIILNLVALLLKSQEPWGLQMDTKLPLWIRPHEAVGRKQ